MASRHRVFALLVLVVTLFGCKRVIDRLRKDEAGGASSASAAALANLDPALARAQKILRGQGVTVRSLERRGNDVVVHLEATSATSYDAQLFVQWCTIFGALASQAPGAVEIVNTADGNPMATVTAQSADVLAYANDEIDFGAFRKRWKTKYVGK